MKSIFALLRPAFKIPTTKWSAKLDQRWIPNVSTFFILAFGLWLFGTGTAIIIKAEIGVAPWTVLSQGISEKTDWSIGFANFIISLCVLTLWLPLKEKPGLGTLMNVIIVAISIDLMMPFFPIPEIFLVAVIQVSFGIIMIGLGSALYLTANLGPGARDGLMTGIQRHLNRPIGGVRFGIEVIVLIIGWLLGGKIGLGTVMFALGCGHCIAIWLTVVESCETLLERLNFYKSKI